MSETPFRLTRWNERLFSLYGPNNGCLSFNDKDYAAQALAYLNGEWNTLLARATAAEERVRVLEARIDAAIEIIEDEDDDPADPLLVRIHTALSREGEKA